MYISSELIFLSYNKKNLVYNYFTNTAVFLNDKTLKIIQKFKGEKVNMNYFEYLNSDELLALKKSNVIYDNINEYYKNDYTKK